AIVPDLTALGATLVAVSPQRPEHSRELIERRHLTFEILSDQGNEVAAAFGLRFTLPAYLRELYRTFPLDLATFNGDASWTLPMPARFVIDRTGVIRAAEADPDYTTRPEPEDTLAVLRTLEG
ncbi:MAG TPA: redoxin domain-containing protein, partial [Methylomirabilota bacterium]|nr:redoxin domain-containing protein [Methylomirabilota bacterium]